MLLFALIQRVCGFSEVGNEVVDLISELLDLKGSCSLYILVFGLLMVDLSFQLLDLLLEIFYPFIVVLVVPEILVLHFIYCVHQLVSSLGPLYFLNRKLVL